MSFFTLNFGAKKISKGCDVNTLYGRLFLFLSMCVCIQVSEKMHFYFRDTNNKTTYVVLCRGIYYIYSNVREGGYYKMNIKLKAHIVAMQAQI